MNGIEFGIKLKKKEISINKTLLKLIIIKYHYHLFMEFFSLYFYLSIS